MAAKVTGAAKYSVSFSRGGSSDVQVHPLKELPRVLKDWDINVDIILAQFWHHHQIKSQFERKAQMRFVSCPHFPPILEYLHQFFLLRRK